MDGVALTAPKSDTDSQPGLHFPGKMEFVQWDSPASRERLPGTWEQALPWILL